VLVERRPYSRRLGTFAVVDEFAAALTAQRLLALRRQD